MIDEKKATDVLKTLAALELGHWSGLRQNTSLDDARAVFSIDDQWHGSGRLGSESRRIDWYPVAAELFPEGLRLWVSGDHIVFIDAVRPELPGGLDKLMLALGQPPERLTSYLGTLPIENSEWVYPERGLTLFVNPVNQRLLRIAVYGPTSLQEYCKFLRLDLQRIRLPLSEQRISGGQQ
jgi:hypothetical protein